MIKIINYEDRYREDVQIVCLNSEGEENAPQYLAGQFILNTFCNYYIDNEPENCFIAVDNGKAIGYIICAENFDKFKNIFDKNYLPLSDSFGANRMDWAKNAYNSQNTFKYDYPAHLHIDILPDYQRAGLGGKLIDALCNHLTSKGVKGVCLTCSLRNEIAVNFYKKYNFTLLSTENNDVCFGKVLIK